MRLRILGCSGGESPLHRATSFLINDDLLLDAGSMTRGLSLAQQTNIDHIFISHCHLDHIRDLAMLADNVIGMRDKPVVIHCTDFTADVLEKHFFNNLIWPNFCKIPNPRQPTTPTMKIERFASETPIRLDGYTVQTVTVNHPVDCQALMVTTSAGTLAYSGDTGPTERLWQVLNGMDRLKGLICEVSFPNDMTKLAEISGHLTPAMLAAELRKFKPKHPVPIYLYHLKPTHETILREQIAALQDNRLIVLRPMDEFTFA